MKRIIWTVVITLLIVICIPMIVLATGIISMSATNEPGYLERSIAALAVNGSLASRAPEKPNPYAHDADAVSTGLEHYATMCARCHGGPGVEPQEFAKGLNPAAPAVDRAVGEFSAGELFWITKHGIRMTGMPAFGVTHDDEELWKIVAFLKQLPNLSNEQKQKLRQYVGEGHGSSETHHTHGESEAEHHDYDEHQNDHTH